MYANIRNGEGGAKLRDEQVRRENRVVPATVAPAKYADPVAFKFAKRDRTTVPLFVREASLFHPAHIVLWPQRVSVGQ